MAKVTIDALTPGPNKIKVRALERGFYGMGESGCRIRKDQEFFIFKGETGSWFEAVSPEVKIEPSKRKQRQLDREGRVNANRAARRAERAKMRQIPEKQPETNGEIARADAKAYLGKTADSTPAKKSPLT